MARRFFPGILLYPMTNRVLWNWPFHNQRWAVPIATRATASSPIPKAHQVTPTASTVKFPYLIFSFCIFVCSSYFSYSSRPLRADSCIYGNAVFGSESRLAGSVKTETNRELFFRSALSLSLHHPKPSRICTPLCFHNTKTQTLRNPLLLLPFIALYCPLLPFIARCCPLLSVVVDYCRFFLTH